MTDLMEALNFTEADLAANRDGKLGPNQRGAIRLFGRIVGLGCALPLTLLVVFFAIRGRTGWFVLLSYGLLVLSLASVAWSVFLSRTGGKVRVHEGVAKKEFRDNNPHTEHDDRFYLTIGDRRMEMDRATYYAFEEGARYRVYQSNNQSILSAERVD